MFSCASVCASRLSSPLYALIAAYLLIDMSLMMKLLAVTPPQPPHGTWCWYYLSCQIWGESAPANSVLPLSFCGTYTDSVHQRWNNSLCVKGHVVYKSADAFRHLRFQASVTRLRHGTCSHFGCRCNPWRQSTQGSGLNLAWCFKTSGQNATALTFTESGPRNLYTLNLNLFLGPLVDDPTLLILWRVAVGSHTADIWRYIGGSKSHTSLLST